MLRKLMLALGMVILVSSLAGTAMAAKSVADLRKDAAKTSACKGQSGASYESCVESYVNSKLREQAANSSQCKGQSGSSYEACVQNYIKSHGGYVTETEQASGGDQVQPGQSDNAVCPAQGCLGKPSVLGIPVLGGGDQAGSAFQTAVTIIGILTGILSVIFIILAGIRYSTSGGNQQKIEGAKQTILYALIGLAISILAPLIIGFVVTKT